MLTPRSKKGVELITEMLEFRLNGRSTESPGDAPAKVGFGGGARDVEAAVDQAVDQSTDDLSPIQNFSALAADIRGQAIEMNDLTIEQHHGDFGPRFAVDGWSSAAFRFARSCRAGNLLGHSTFDVKYKRELLVPPTDRPVRSDRAIP